MPFCHNATYFAKTFNSSIAITTIFHHKIFAGDAADVAFDPGKINKTIYHNDLFLGLFLPRLLPHLYTDVADVA
jgi:hypothetical protein